MYQIRKNMNVCGQYNKCLTLHNIPALPSINKLLYRWTRTQESFNKSIE